MRGSRVADADDAENAAAATAVAPPEVREQVPQIARARALAVTKTAPSHRLQTGDLICGNCGEGNAPSRKFCSRCGDSLVEAAIVEASWWHRFRPRRGPKTIKLGAEKGKAASGGSLRAPRLDVRHLASTIYRKARVVVALAIVAAGVIYGVFPPFRNDVNSIFTHEKAKISGIIDQKFAPIHPVKCTASAQVAGHSGSLVCDGFFNNYWLAPFQTSPQPTITMTFAHPVTITRLILHNGAFGRYVQDGRPSSLHLVFSNDETFTITPQDSSQAQTFVIKHALLIKSIVFQVTSTYQGTQGANVAISQIELFGIQ
ncbi:MAG TPA: zinc ribbon domain-containing protein [Verrucomicrobiae bacterium]|nr:zinc ribbon domain-containing protein [Verrucomicrobiae bacterium]